MKVIYSIDLAGYPIQLMQAAPDKFTVIYGIKSDSKLTYSEAAQKLGEAIMHSLACNGDLMGTPE